MLNYAIRPSLNIKIELFSPYPNYALSTSYIRFAKLSISTPSRLNQLNTSSFLLLGRKVGAEAYCQIRVVPLGEDC